MSDKLTEIFGRLKVSESMEKVIEEADTEVQVVAMRREHMSYFDATNAENTCSQCGATVVHRAGIPTDRVTFWCDVCFLDKLDEGELDKADIRTTNADITKALDHMVELARMTKTPLTRN